MTYGVITAFYMVLAALLNPSAWGINIWAFQFVNSIANPALNYIMALLAESFYIVLPLVAIYMIWRKDTNVYSFIVAVILLFIIGYGLKYAFQVPRPCSLPSLSWINAPAGCESGFSFPSDHAMVLTGLVFFIRKYRRVEILYSIWMVLVLFGRIYLGAHYFTDVIAGAVISLIIAYFIYRYRDMVYNTLKRFHLTILTPREEATHIQHES